MNKFNKFDLIWSTGGNSTIYVVLSEELEIPCFEDGCASGYAFTPLDFTNPDEWGRTFPGYIVWNTREQKYEILSIHHGYEKVKLEITNGYIPFDQGTAQLRNVLGLITLTEKMYGNKVFNFKLEEKNKV